MSEHEYKSAYVGEIGFIFELHLILSFGGTLDGFTPYIIAKKPSGEDATWNAVVHDSPGCIIRYVTVEGDLDELGLYKAMPRLVETDSGTVIKQYYGRTFVFQVKDLFA